MFCVINAALDAFRDSWNNHSVSTMHCFTANQLFIQGAFERNRYIQYPLPSQRSPPPVITSLREAEQIIPCTP